MAAPTARTLSGATFSIDLTTRDFEGFRSDSLELAYSVAPEWTDRSELDIGVTLVEALSFMSGNLSYYQDRVGNEALFPSAVQRRSVIQHAKLIGYELRPNVSAQVELTIVSNATGTLLAGQQVDVDTSDGSDPATFELEIDTVFTGAETKTGVIALEGVTVSETLGSSSGASSQEFLLASNPLTLNPDGTSSLEVYVAEGGPPIQWAEVDNFLESGATDQVYRIEIDEEDVVTVLFGDGVNGKSPSAGTNNVSAVYRVGGGQAGNSIGPDRLTKLVNSPVFIDTATNPDQPSGGQDKETLDEAKEQAPASTKSNDRAVSHADYKTQAQLVPGVAQALAYNGAGVYEEIVVIAAAGSNPVPTGSWDPLTATGTGLLGNVGTWLEERKTTPVIILMYPAISPSLYLDMTVHLFNTIRRVDATRFVEDAIKAAITPDVLTFGQQVPLSLIADIIEDIDGVDYVDVNRMQRQPYGRKLRLAAVDLTFDVVIGANTPRDRYAIQFISQTEYTVTAQGSGIQSSNGTTGVLYAPDDGFTTWTISVATSPPSAGDQWEIVTGPYLGNLDPDPDELAQLAGGTFVLSLVGGLG